MSSRFRALAVAAMLAGAAAWADGGPSFAVDAGAIDVIGLPPAQLGFYPYVGVSVAIPAGPVAFIPGLSIEGSPDAMRWGGVATLAIDYGLTKDLGIDLNLALIHDQAGLDFANALFFFGAGPGVSFFLGRFTVSASVGIFRGLNVDAWAVVPALNVAYSF